MTILHHSATQNVEGAVAGKNESCGWSFNDSINSMKKKSKNHLENIFTHQ